MTERGVDQQRRIEASHVHTDPEDDVQWEIVRPRNITTERWARYQGYIAEILESLGMDLATPGTSRTPERFLKALLDSTAGYEGDPKLLTVFPTECRGGPDCRISQIIEGPISFFALCEHHALPFHGTAYVGYVAHENIIGISKLTRLVRVFARRFTVQERVGQQVADALMDLMQPSTASPSISRPCICARRCGVSERKESSTWTSFWRGTYEEDSELRRSSFQAAKRAR